MGLRYLATLVFAYMVWYTQSQSFQITGQGAQEDFSKLKIPQTCKETPRNSSGVFLIHPDKGFGEPFFAQCDHKHESGGWTVIQNRFDGSVNFYRPWSDYKNGFGHLDREFWLGLDRITRLTNAKTHELHVVMTRAKRTYVAKYTKFAIGSETESYHISVLGRYSGPAKGDALEYHKNRKFSTFDRDNDASKYNCAVKHTGAWWYGDCHKSNLNGNYTTTTIAGMCWFIDTCWWHMKTSRMLIRSRK
ncbi:fibrinogen-like protein A [Topomyia yanbarensis]|uniref:fibrinogen-like protein A n=1 Tax=Topomyia yanbarensis TaxID=2498891 RepID=UPI00273C3F8B|nr:fibrinogen-like protein A [Topomyia yanbarensis]